MTAGPGDRAAIPPVVMHGQARDDSTFKQAGIEVNISCWPLRRRRRCGTRCRRIRRRSPAGARS